MIQSISISQKDYDVQQREELSRRLHCDAAEPHVLLATCNRTELYWGSGDASVATARHLFSVAAGLQSALLGERAIQGQLKQAYATALHNYRLSPQLNRLFQCAMHVGKRVRTETRIAAGAVSHSQVTADLLRAQGIDLAGKVVAIVGVNKLTEDILKFLSSRGAENVYLANRNLPKAQAIAAKYSATATPLENKRELLRVADVLICATSAPHAIVHLDDMPRHDNPMLIVDLSFPRNVEPAVGELPGVSLFNLDDIERFAQANRDARQNEVSHAWEIVDEEVEKLLQWQTNRLIDK